MVPKKVGDTFPVRGAGQMEASFTAPLYACDGSPPLATNKALLERAEQPRQQQTQGLRGWPHTSGHSQLGPVLQRCLADRAHLLWQHFVVEVVGRAAIASLGPD